MSDIPIDVDAFAASIDQLLGEIDRDVTSAANKAVPQSLRKGAKELRETYATFGKHVWSDEYREGFTSRTSRTGKQVEGEIGNKNKPGLVHLLEKGHATLNGRRTNAYPHLAPAFEELQEDFVERMERLIGESLGV